MIKHVSFDVWNTLIVSHPEFGAARRRLIADHFDLPLVDVEAVYRRVKDGSDLAAEATGAGMSSAEVYEHFMSELGMPEANWYDLRDKIEKLFIKFAPVVPPAAASAIRQLTRFGINVSIGSNTNFIRGSCLTEASLDAVGVDWSFKTFSDEIGVSKPHPYFWKVIQERALAHSDAEAHEILHVGDHMICDAGCRDHGINFEHVNSPADIARVLEGVYESAAA